MNKVSLRGLLRIFTPSFRRHRLPTKEVAILVPIAKQSILTESEQISISQLIHHLGSYDRYFIAPQESTIQYPGFQIITFSDKFFGSAAAHGKLLNYLKFYRQFEDYRYILFYHLDSLVFSDELIEWCSKGFDYIGAPWICCDDSPWVTRPRVGNGGFALLNVGSAINVICQRYQQDPSAYWLDLFTRNYPASLIFWLRWINHAFPQLKWVNRLLKEWREMSDPIAYNRNNDIFWSDRATSYMPNFHVATVEEGLKFAFEVSPRSCFKLNGGRMPFGCHAWTRYDPEFWEPHLVHRKHSKQDSSYHPI